MSGRRFSVIFIPRHTTYVGPGPFATLPIDVSAFDRVQLYAWRGNLVGTLPTIRFIVQQSSDRDRWINLDVGVDPGSFSEGSYAYGLSTQYIRLTLLGSAADQLSTCYAYGFLERRQPPNPADARRRRDVVQVP